MVDIITRGLGAARVALCLLFLAGCTRSALLPPKAIQMNDEGARALAAGDYVTAEARIDLALEYNDQFTEAWANKGLIAYKKGFWIAAREHFVRARSLNANIPTPHHGLGLVSEAEGKLPEAEAHYLAAIHVDPGFAPARANLGRLLFARKAYDEARDQFFKLTEIAPESLEGWCGLIESLLQLEQEEEADAQIVLARKRFGDDVGRLNVLRARRYLDVEQYALAERLLAPATEDSDPLHAANAWAWLSIERTLKGDIPGSLYAAKEAKRIDPRSEIARYAAEQAQLAADHEEKVRRGK